MCYRFATLKATITIMCYWFRNLEGNRHNHVLLLLPLLHNLEGSQHMIVTAFVALQPTLNMCYHFCCFEVCVLLLVDLLPSIEGS